MLPAFALAAPPIVFLLALASPVGLVGQRLLEAYALLIGLSPVLGLVTLAILLVRYPWFAAEFDPMRTSRRRAARLAVWAILAPAWLVVMFFIAAGFNR